MMQLGDDGTLNTVIVCSDCGEEFRFNFDSEADEGGYHDFVAWAKREAAEDHECPKAPTADRYEAIRDRRRFGDDTLVVKHGR